MSLVVSPLSHELCPQPERRASSGLMVNQLPPPGYGGRYATSGPQMTEKTIRRINALSFITALATIIVGVIVGILGVWDVVSRDDGLLWKLLASDGIVFAGAVLTNLAIACYRKPGGDVA